MSSSPISRSNPAIYVSGNPPSKPGTPTYPNRRNEYPAANSYTNYNTPSNSSSPARISTGLPGAMSASPRPRLRPSLDKRESLLRASILDTAMELGVGAGGAVERWMFGAIGEDEEDESTVSPSLTYASTAPSDESWLNSSMSSQQASPLPNGKSLVGVTEHLNQRTVQFAPAVAPSEDPELAAEGNEPLDSREHKSPGQTLSKKLRKAKPDDGYTSDGAGYMSDGVGKSKSKKKSKKEKKDKGEESDGGYLSDVLSRRRKKKEKVPDLPVAKSRDADLDGDETDGGYLSSSGIGSFARSRKMSSSKAKTGKKSKGGDEEEESDGGYLSSTSKKRRFFGLRGRKQSDEDTQRSSADSRTRPTIPPVPSLPPMPLPIADRFRSDTPTSNLSLDLPVSMYSAGSRAATPMSNMRASESSGRRSSGDSNAPPTPVISMTPSPMTPPSSSRTLPPPSPSYLAVHSSGASINSLESPRALTHAFGDAESVRSPSIDVLKAFGRQAGLSALSPTSPVGSSASVHSYSTTTSYGTVIGHHGGLSQDSNSPYTLFDAQPRTPTGGAPKPTPPKPKMKRTLSQKRTPMPTAGHNTSNSMTFSALGVRSIEALQEGTDEEEEQDIEAGDEDDQVLVVTPATPGSDKTKMSNALGPSSPSSSSRAPSPQPLNLSNSNMRPNALGKYDIPPPSPPPSRPLPSVPPSPSRESQSSRGDRSSGSADSHRPPPSPLSKSASAADLYGAAATSTPAGKRRGMLRPGTAPSASEQPSSPPASATLTTFPRSPVKSSFGGRPGTTPTRTPPDAPSTPSHAPPTYTGAPGATPLFLNRIPSNSDSVQRGRTSPFPARPVLPLSRSGSPLPPPRAPSPMQMRPPPQPPASAGLVMDGTRYGQRMHRHFGSEGQGQGQRLDVHWQPRSASALDNRRYARPESDDFSDKQSWVDFEDEDEDAGDDTTGSTLAYHSSQMSSYSDQGRHSDEIDSVLEIVNGRSGRNGQDEDLDSDSDGRGDDPRGPDTEYYTSGSAFPSDVEDEPDVKGAIRRPPMPPIPVEPDTRLSAYTEFDDADYEEGDRKSRVSIMDDKRSGKAREKLMRRVEALKQETE